MIDTLKQKPRPELALPTHRELDAWDGLVEAFLGLGSAAGVTPTQAGDSLRRNATSIIPRLLSLVRVLGRAFADGKDAIPPLHALALDDALVAALDGHELMPLAQTALENRRELSALLGGNARRTDALTAAIYAASHEDPEGRRCWCRLEAPEEHENHCVKLRALLFRDRP